MGKKTEFLFMSEPDCMQKSVWITQRKCSSCWHREII